MKYIICQTCDNFENKMLACHSNVSLERLRYASSSPSSHTSNAVNEGSGLALNGPSKGNAVHLFNRLSHHAVLEKQVRQTNISSQKA